MMPHFLFEPGDFVSMCYYTICIFNSPSLLVGEGELQQQQKEEKKKKTTRKTRIFFFFHFFSELFVLFLVLCFDLLTFIFLCLSLSRSIISFIDGCIVKCIRLSVRYICLTFVLFSLFLVF